MPHHWGEIPADISWRSDSELPETFRLSITPSGAAGNGVLKSPYCFATPCEDERIAIDRHDIETHVVGIIECSDGFRTEDFRKMFLEKLSLASAKEEESGSFPVIAFRADQRGNSIRIPSVVHCQLRGNRRDIRQWCVVVVGIHIDRRAMLRIG